MKRLRRENVIRIFAGGLVFISTLLGALHNPYWLLLTMFVGLNLFQFGFSGWCPLDIMLRKLGVPR
ncbi:MAG: YgaP family membrane protein [Nanoarchaeota archaeon]